MEDQTTTVFDTTIRFESLNHILAKQPEMSLSGVTIQNLALKGDTEWVYATADVTGLYNGKVIVQFKVSFDNTEKRIRVNEVNLDLADDTMFAKMAGKMVNNMFAGKLDTKLEEVVNAKFSDMLKDVFAQVKTMPLQGGASIGIDVQSYSIRGLKTSSTGLHFLTELTGRGSLTY